MTNTQQLPPPKQPKKKKIIIINLVLATLIISLLYFYLHKFYVSETEQTLPTQQETTKENEAEALTTQPTIQNIIPDALEQNANEIASFLENLTKITPSYNDPTESTVITSHVVSDKVTYQKMYNILLLCLKIKEELYTEQNNNLISYIDNLALNIENIASLKTTILTLNQLSQNKIATYPELNKQLKELINYPGLQDENYNIFSNNNNFINQQLGKIVKVKKIKNSEQILSNISNLSLYIKYGDMKKALATLNKIDNEYIIGKQSLEANIRKIMILQDLLKIIIFNVEHINLENISTK